MRLINTATLELSEFFDSQVPPYAILSHCWGENEVSIQEFKAGANKQGSGYAKITNCCRLAKDRKLSWVDTCCIDKTSSAELTEAINSMFTWYENAEVCFAFLSDLEKVNEVYDLSSCRWFTRGFTLQELLAPREVIFFDASSMEVGTNLPE